jgi:hypothetical protein
VNHIPTDLEENMSEEQIIVALENLTVGAAENAADAAGPESSDTRRQHKGKKKGKVKTESTSQI